MKKEFYISIAVFLIFSTSLFSQEISIYSGTYIYEGTFVGVFDDIVNEEDTLINEGHISLINSSLENYVPFIGTGTLELSGTNFQMLSGGSDIKVDTLFLNNTSSNGIVFDNDIYIRKLADFTSGILADANESNFGDPRDLYFVQFDTDAGVVNVTDDSHIEGLVKKVGISSFMMPIGDDGYYRPLYIYDSNVESNYSAKYFCCRNIFPEPNVPSLTNINRTEYWFLESDQSVFNFNISYSDAVSDINLENLDLLAVAEYNGLLESDVVIKSLFENFDFTDIDRRYFTVSVDNETLGNTDFGSAVWFGYASIIPTGGEFPQFLTPNGDSANDVFDVPSQYLYVDNRIEIFNRYGNLVYKTSGYDNTWDGKPNQPSVGGKDGYLPTGTYYVLFYVSGELIYKGFLQLLLSN